MAEGPIIVVYNMTLQSKEFSMNSNPTNDQYVKDEISLKELILVIWNRKITIISITIVLALLAGLITKFATSPVYDTKLNIIISMPENFQTRYGEYKLPLTTNEQYIRLFTSNDVLVRTIEELNLTDEMKVDNLRSKISINNSASNAQTSNTFEVKVSANNPEASLELAETLYNNYIKFLDIMIKEQVVNYFYNKYTVELISLENSIEMENELLKSNEELLAQTKMELSSIKSDLGILNRLGEDSVYTVPVDTINPNYIMIETDIINNKQTINSLSTTINMNQKYIEELEVQKHAIEKYYETGKTNGLSLDLTSAIESNVYMPSLPVAPLYKTGPSTIKNTAIGGVLGGMLGITIALFQWYWKKEM